MRLSVPLPFIAAAALLWPAAQQIAQATPYTYTFQPGATTVLGGNTELRRKPADAKPSGADF